MSAATPSTETYKNPPRFAIACPSCEYLLHGLGGPVVTCPECGATCDIVELARQYRARWSTTPLYERMMRPATLAMLILVFLPAAMSIFLPELAGLMTSGAVLLWIVVGILLTAWVILALLAIRGLPFGTGAMLLLTLHLTMAGYLICGVGVFAGLIGLIGLPVAILNVSADTAEIVLCAVVTAIGILCALAFRLLWKLDQFVGRACLRHSIHVESTEESTHAKNPAM
jgi:hypothetical protein